MDPSKHWAVAGIKSVHGKVGLQMAFRIIEVRSETIQQSRTHKGFYVIIICRGRRFNHQLVSDIGKVNVIDSFTILKYKFRCRCILENGILIIDTNCFGGSAVQDSNDILHSRLCICFHDVIVHRLIAGEGIACSAVGQDPAIVRNHTTGRTGEIHFAAQCKGIIRRCVFCLQKNEILLPGCRQLIRSFDIYGIGLGCCFFQRNYRFDRVIVPVKFLHITDKIVSLYIVSSVCIHIIVGFKSGTIHGSVQTCTDCKFLRIKTDSIIGRFIVGITDIKFTVFENDGRRRRIIPVDFFQRPRNDIAISIRGFESRQQIVSVLQFRRDWLIVMVDELDVHRIVLTGFQFCESDGHAVVGTIRLFFAVRNLKAIRQLPICQFTIVSNDAIYSQRQFFV